MGYIEGILFQSTLLMRGATSRQDKFDTEQILFQSTLLMRGATVCQGRVRAVLMISIHAPHARSDSAVIYDRQVEGYFNPRSSCEERRPAVWTHTGSNDFNPRSSCEERPVACRLTGISGNFNPRSSCEERRRRRPVDAWHADISIHAPHARGDTIEVVAALIRGISIHAPHARSDEDPVLRCR